MTSSGYKWKPTIRLSISKLKFELTLWRPNICLKWPGFQVSAFGAPISEKYIHAWKQKSAYYRGGFVLRVLWFGFCLRYGAVKVKRKKQWPWDKYFFDDMPDDAIPFAVELALQEEGDFC